MNFRSHAVAPTRAFDHLYDPVYTPSGNKDVWRENGYALARSAAATIVPIYQTMFTDLPRRNRAIYFLNRNQLPHCPYVGGKLIKPDKPVEVSGPDRSKYFAHPTLKTHETGMNLELDLIRCQCIVTPRTPPERFGTVGCQTIYREQSAQTKPYMPDAFINENEPQTPEVVYVANLIKGDKQPGVFEAEIVERARVRRQWERSLPPITSVKDWYKRRTILEALEWEQWVAREDEIEDCQKLRLQLVQRLMEKRKKSMKEISEMKLENTSQRLIQQKEKKLQQLKNKFARRRRVLEMYRNGTSRRYRKMDVATEHIEPASDLYAPQLRFGVHPRHKHFVAYKTDYNAKLDAMDIISNELPDLEKYLKPKIDITKPKTELKEVKRGLMTNEYLEKLYEDLKSLRHTKQPVEKIPNCLEYIKTEDTGIAPTPIQSYHDIFEDTDYQHVIHLQSLIKGRAIQCIVARGRNKCRGLISELQSTHQLSSVAGMYPKHNNEIARNRKIVLGQQKRMEGILRAEEQINEVLLQAEGIAISKLLQFLEIELQTLIEQRKAHALYMLAERERLKREAEEAGKRQIAEKRRQEHNEIYQLSTSIHHDTATMYLEHCLTDNMERVGECEAKNIIYTLAKRIDQEADNNINPNYHGVKKNNKIVVSELVNSFVFPEVYKRIVRRQNEIKSKTDLLVAHNALYKTVDNLSMDYSCVCSAEKINASILNNLLADIISSTTTLSTITSDEDAAQHELMWAIKRAINIALPDEPKVKPRKWKTSSERVVGEVIGDLIKAPLPSKPCVCTERASSDSSSDRSIVKKSTQTQLAAVISEYNKKLQHLADTVTHEDSITSEDERDIISDDDD